MKENATKVLVQADGRNGYFILLVDGKGNALSTCPMRRVLSIKADGDELIVNLTDR